MSLLAVNLSKYMLTTPLLLLLLLLSDHYGRFDRIDRYCGIDIDKDVDHLEDPQGIGIEISFVPVVMVIVMVIA